MSFGKLLKDGGGYDEAEFLHMLVYINKHIMKKNLFSFVIVFFAFFSLASAQVSNKDSLSLVNKIASGKEKLVKLEASVAGKEKDKKETAVQAQESADDNRKAAGKLSDDPQDKKLARRAG